MFWIGYVTGGLTVPLALWGLLWLLARWGDTLTDAEYEEMP